MIVRRLRLARHVCRVDTQRLREKLLMRLKELFDMSCGQARNKGLDLWEREKWARVAAYTAQVMEGLAKGFDESQVNKQLDELESLVGEARAKGKVRAAEEGPPAGPG
jgi:hypothetical protein